MGVRVSKKEVDMTTAITTRLIKIGNSQGIRIPKLLLSQLGMVDEVTLEAQDDRLVVRPVQTVRQGWDEQFQAMAASGEDQLLDADALPPTDWESSEWEWQ
jgi:antitoxin MazE